jgi:hypothetical protein|tara:strand:- start:1063 stop:1233 length:171 start_codon:yes stop_codon:yes gene_type:complete
MGYSEQLQAVIDEVGAEIIIDCLLGEYSEKAMIAAQLSKDNDGSLSQAEKDLISTL